MSTSTHTNTTSQTGGQDKLAGLHEQISDGVAALVESQGWRAMLDTAAKFHSYSLGNLLLIGAQAPQATRVAGFRTWQSLGRQVRKGERASRSWRRAPTAPRRPTGPSRPDRSGTSQLPPAAGEWRPTPAAGRSGASAWCMCLRYTKPKGRHCPTSPRACWSGRHRPGCGTPWKGRCSGTATRCTAVTPAGPTAGPTPPAARSGSATTSTTPTP